MRRTAILAAVLLVTAVAVAQDPHPNDDKVVFFKEPDKATKKRILEAVRDWFAGDHKSKRADGRAVCYEYPRWSVPFLVRLLDGTDKSRPIQRWNAILTLARIADPRAVSTLRAVAEDDNNPQVRAFACLALGYQEGPDPVRILIRVMKQDKAQIVVVAATLALARLGGSEAENAIVPLAKLGASDLERRTALVALGFFPTATAAETARGALGDSKTAMRWRAVLALANGAFGPREERQAELGEIFEKRGREDGKVRAMALLALARFESWRGASTRIADALRDPDTEVVAAAARALQHRGDPRTRDAILETLRREMQGDAHLIARLLIALADIETRSPSEEGTRFLVSRLEARNPAVRVYAAIALTRLGDAPWEAFPALRERTVSMMRGRLRGGALGDEERGNLRRALGLLDPTYDHPEMPEDWTSPWGDEDEILPTLDATLHQAFLDLTNWFFEEEMGLHAITDVPLSRHDLESGTAREISAENKPLRDLKEWLKEAPYFTEDRLPDRGYEAP